MASSIKTTSYYQKIQILAPFFESICETVKKDLKGDFLQRNPSFAKQYFAKQHIARLSAQELAKGYQQALKNSENEELAEYIASGWLLKHTDLYHFFEEQLRQLNPNFDQLELIDDAAANSILSQATQQFNAAEIYLFSIINSVVFSDTVFENLRNAALHSLNSKTDGDEKQSQDWQKQLQKVQEKYELKLAGMQKKYTTDVAALKKQIGELQRQACRTLS